MTMIDITRRSLLGGLAASAVPAPAIGAGTIVPAGNVNLHEDPCTKVERLAHELSDALDDYHGGKFHALAYPSSAGGEVYFRKTELPRVDPKDELRVAIGRVKMAMLHLTGKMPGDFSKIDDRHSVVALAVLPEYMTMLKWFYDDGGSLLADDVNHYSAIKFPPIARGACA